MSRVLVIVDSTAGLQSTHSHIKAIENPYWGCSWQHYKMKVGAQFLKDLDFTISQTEDQSSRVCSPCSNKVRSTRAEFYIKTSFQESEHNDDSFRKNVHITSRFCGSQGNSIAVMSASLIASTWSLIILHNYDATNITFFSFCLCFTAWTMAGKLNFSQNPCGKNRQNIRLPQ